MSAAEFRRIAARPRRHKYGAKPTVVDGMRFHSLKEANRYGELKLLEKGGKIRCLQLQPSFPFMIRGKIVFTYRADFSYWEVNGNGEDERHVVEDTKGFRTRDYRLKKKIIEAEYGIEIIET